MIFSSGADSVVVPRAVRINLVLRLIIPWRLPAWPANTRPLAVTLNRFLQLDFVFILGISVSYQSKSVFTRLGMPLWPDVHTSASYMPASPNWQAQNRPHRVSDCYSESVSDNKRSSQDATRRILVVPSTLNGTPAVTTILSSAVPYP